MSYRYFADTVTLELLKYLRVARVFFYIGKDESAK